MALTNFPNGISSMGIPVYGVGIPPIRGTYFHVFPGTGSDGNNGRSKDKPLATFGKAYDLCTTNRGDGIIIYSSSESAAKTSTYLSAVIDWTKNDITVVGVNSGNVISNRSRITNLSTATSLAYLMDVQGSNNSFYNIQIANYGSNVAAVGGVKVTGSRNAFFNCHLVGAGHATPQVVATANSLMISGNENLIAGCTIGINTLAGTLANINGVILLDGTGSDGQNNSFVDCLVLQAAGAASTTSGMVKWGGAGDAITRPVLFKNCVFAAYATGAVAGATNTVLQDCFVGTAPNNGIAMVANCYMFGITNWDSATGNDRVWVTGPAGNAAGGKAVVAS